MNHLRPARIRFQDGSLLVALCVSAAAGCAADAKAGPQMADAAAEAPIGSESGTRAEEPAQEAAAAPAGPTSGAASAVSPPDAQAVSGAKSKDPNAPREVKYVVTPEGLKAELAGVRFLTTAQARQVARGWGVKVTVKAEVLDGKTHVLLSPKNGPIAFAAAVYKKGSTEAERIPDRRDGDDELKLSPDAPLSFSRDFPTKGGRVLAIGETLDMEVALWGLGEGTEDRRPVKQFVHVKMKVDNGKPKAVVEPPASAAK